MSSSSVENGRRIQLPCGELAFSTAGSGPVLMQALGHRRASVMGHSLGGSIALRAVALPGVETAVLVAEQLTKTVSRARRLLPFRLVQQGAARGTDRLVSFVRVTRSVINWQGQRVNPPHQAALLNALSVFLAWGDDDTHRRSQGQLSAPRRNTPSLLFGHRLDGVWG